MEIQSIVFQRNEGDKGEKGLLISQWDEEKKEQNSTIIDMKGLPITDMVWDIAYRSELIINYK